MKIKYGAKQNHVYNPGEFVKIHISNINKAKYLASKLELLGTPNYSELDIVPLNKTLSLKQASIKQNYTLWPNLKAQVKLIKLIKA
ncbi:hypothetical protein C2G38_2226152 [Gigaspora rosea]|uniref:Uncharacterized protein n=1 Tax=Gigaspora rosea TaxID=44941 RepID=A0A397U068_9GLOM|nr:hypothetical protein C2G38_2226152 [Gigaspora rosea]